MSLLLLLSCATGLTLGVLLVKRQLSGRILAAFVIAAVIACFALFIFAIDAEVTDISGTPVLNSLSWAALCGLIFSITLGIGTLMTAIVAEVSNSNSKGRRT